MFEVFWVIAALIFTAIVLYAIFGGKKLDCEIARLRYEIMLDNIWYDEFFKAMERKYGKQTT